MCTKSQRSKQQNDLHVRSAVSCFFSVLGMILVSIVKSAIAFWHCSRYVSVPVTNNLAKCSSTSDWCKWFCANVQSALFLSDPEDLWKEYCRHVACPNFQLKLWNTTIEIFLHLLPLLILLTIDLNAQRNCFKLVFLSARDVDGQP